MEFTSVSSVGIDTSALNHITNKLAEKYGLIVRSVSSIDCSFERALSICLFGTEEEVKSISSTLYSQYDW